MASTPSRATPSWHTPPLPVSDTQPAVPAFWPSSPAPQAPAGTARASVQTPSAILPRVTGASLTPAVPAMQATSDQLASELGEDRRRVEVDALADDALALRLELKYRDHAASELLAGWLEAAQ